MIWGYILGGATIFALIVGLFSVYNGRATRKLIMEEERRTQEMLERAQGTLDRMQKTLDRMEGLQERAQGTLEKQGEILVKLSEQHSAMIERLKSS